MIRLVRCADREHVRVDGGVARRVTFLARVSGGGDDEAAQANRLGDRPVDEPVRRGRAEAEIDDRTPRLGRRPDALGDVGRGQLRPVAERCVERSHHRRGIDPDDADPVRRRADHGCNGCSVDAADRCRLLRVQRGEVGAADELRMGKLDTRVDDGHRHARSRRGERVDPHVRAPPLLRDQRIGEVARRSKYVGAGRCRARGRSPGGHGAENGKEGDAGDHVDLSRQGNVRAC